MSDNSASAGSGMTPFQPTQEQDETFDLWIPGKTSADYENRKFSVLEYWKDPTKDGEKIRRTEVLDYGDEAFLLHGLLSPAECQHYIQQGENLGFGCTDKDDKGTINYRSSKRIIFRSLDLSELLWKRIETYLADIDINGDPHLVHIHGPEKLIQGNWKPCGVNDVFRICRYYPGGHFAPHFDGHYVVNAQKRSMKTLMVYLNDIKGVSAGGTTNFVNETQQLYKDANGKYCAEEKNILYRIPPEEGMAILFNHHRLHEGEALREGVKYILRTDILFELQAGNQNPLETEGLLLVQEAERKEAAGDNIEAMELYRKAFKMSPDLAASYGN